MRRMKWRGYEVSFHDLQSKTYTNNSIYRKRDIILHLPFGAVKVGEVVHAKYKYKTWHASGLDWYVLGHSAHAWERGGTAKSVTLKMLDKAYPDLGPGHEQ